MYGELPEVQLPDGSTVRGYQISIPAPPKSAVVRLPTSAELLTYLAAQRSLYKDLGRRMGEPQDVPTPKADQALFRAIRLDTPADESQEFDDAEALYAIGLITRHRIDGCERDGQSYIISLATMFGVTKHTVSIPFQKDIAEYRRHVYYSRDLPHGIEERRFPPEVPVKLYDAVKTSVEGYAPGTDVPPHHKRAVVAELLASLASLDPSLDPNS